MTRCAAAAQSKAMLPLLLLRAVAADYLSITTDVPKGDGKIVIEVNAAQAPLGAAHLHALVNDSFYNGAAFFRVVPGFVVQFGIAGIPAENAKWKVPIKDDPVSASNTFGTLTYATAGPNTRTSQLFINLADNHGLDAQGFAPFGRVVQGMDVVQAISNPTPGSSGGVDQDRYATEGNAWIRKAYPNINSIKNATFGKAAAMGLPLPPRPDAADTTVEVWASESSKVSAVRAPTPSEVNEVLTILGSVAGGLVVSFFVLLWGLRAWQCWARREDSKSLLAKEDCDQHSAPSDPGVEMAEMPSDPGVEIEMAEMEPEAGSRRPVERKAVS